MAQHSAIVRHYAGICIRPSHIGKGLRPVEFGHPSRNVGRTLVRLVRCWPPPKLPLRQRRHAFTLHTSSCTAFLNTSSEVIGANLSSPCRSSAGSCQTSRRSFK